MPHFAGDPEGRRLARRRATHLAEAGALARALEVLLKRAAFDVSGCTNLAQGIAHQEAIEIQRAAGRIESRKRFKSKSGQPLLEGRTVSSLCLDECGKSGKEPESQPQYFALAAVAMHEEDVEQYVKAADAIKQEFFKRVDITFHEPMMRERDGPYLFEGNTQRQAEFDQAIERLVNDTPFTAFGVGVRKKAFEDEFVTSGIDPYLPTDAYAVAIQMLLERYVDFLATSPTRRMGRVTFESQGPREDAEHQLQYALVLLDGTQWVPQSAFWNWLESGCRFMPKCGSHPTELADMFSRDILGVVSGWVSNAAEALAVLRLQNLLSRRWLIRQVWTKSVPRLRHQRQNRSASACMWCELKLKAPTLKENGRRYRESGIH